ncbi:MAG: pyridoxal phosphate-dependent aminotransferase [Candidatus Micrarchaeota archaeon]
MKSLAARNINLFTENAFAFSSNVKELEKTTGKIVVKLHIGEPDFKTPANIRSACIKAINELKTGYTVPEGIPELRQAVSSFYSRFSGFEPKLNQVLITPGTKASIHNAISLVAEQGREVLIPNPGYPAYLASTRFFGATPVSYGAVEYDAEELKEKVSSKTVLLVLNSPSNPTGRVLSSEFLKTARDLVVDNDLFVLSDEIYSRIVYGSEFKSLGGFPEVRDKLILLDGFSKTYAMTGWRLGWMVVPEELFNAAKVVGINSFSCPNNFVQWAGIEALNGPQDAIGEMVSEYKNRRDFVVKRLNEIKGVSCALPEGAFYAFPNVSELIKGKLTSKELQLKLLNEHFVSVLSGTDFGDGGEGFIRLSYASSIENLDEGVNRIEKALKEV